MDNIIENIYNVLNKQDKFNWNVAEDIKTIANHIDRQEVTNNSQRRINWILWGFTFGVGYICAKSIGELRAEIEELKHVKGA